MMRDDSFIPFLYINTRIKSMNIFIDFIQLKVYSIAKGGTYGKKTRSSIGNKEKNY